MEDSVTAEPYKPTKEELQQELFDDKAKELRIQLARASVVKQQATRAYGIVEDIRLDFLGDTAFRGKLTSTKKGLESFLGDFLLDDHYWREKIKEHRSRTPKEYAEYIDSISYADNKAKK